MKKNLQTAALAVLLIFVPGSVVVSRGAGGSISSVTNVPIQTWGEAASQKDAVSSGNASGMSNKMLADSTSAQRPYVEVNTMPQTTTSTQNQSNSVPSSQLSCPTCYDTSEHTAEILVPGNFNTISEKESLLPVAESYSVTVCVSFKGKTAEDCKESFTPFQAGDKLAANMIRKYVTSAGTRPFRVVLPSSVSSSQQVQILRQIEKRAIDVFESVMMKNPDSEKQDVFAEEIRIARQEADGGVNWSQDIKSDRLAYNYIVGQALDMVNSMIISLNRTKEERPDNRK